MVATQVSSKSAGNGWSAPSHSNLNLGHSWPTQSEKTAGGSFCCVLCARTSKKKRTRPVLQAAAHNNDQKATHSAVVRQHQMAPCCRKEQMLAKKKERRHHKRLRRHTRCSPKLRGPGCGGQGAILRPRCRAAVAVDVRAKGSKSPKAAQEEERARRRSALGCEQASLNTLGRGRGCRPGGKERRQRREGVVELGARWARSTRPLSATGVVVECTRV